ncbi:MAG: DoxX family protein [Edaphobacter sp.]|uniref:DoxX family protein n=1 Tax=Edaphobacter sp. TaxID=1934404 RepID=UPI00239F7A7F|nr:DoxX family protein [Edaphobacter sp.]MDE1175603.1 DoxX family protein [Edaphobacter sp.]
MMHAEMKDGSSKPLALLCAIEGSLRSLGHTLAPPVLRVALALPFFRSGKTRWDGFPHLAFATPFLFEDVFKLHLLGHAFSLPSPVVTAYVVAVAEIVLPTLLVLGLATRQAALGLLIMTGVIQLVAPDGWANFHLYWAAIALAILALGPGKLSLDFAMQVAARNRRQLSITEKDQPVVSWKQQQ